MGLGIWADSVGRRFVGLANVINSMRDQTVVRRCDKAGLLARLCHERPLVSVGVPGSPHRFNSALMEVSTNADVLWLDELSPGDERLPLAPHTRLEIHGQLDGRQLRFKAPVAALDEREGMPCYRLAGPRLIHFKQRRLHNRVKPMDLVRVYLVDPAANLIDGSLMDISLGGLSVKLDNPGAVDLSRGVRVSSCTVRLTAMTAVQSAVEIRYVRQSSYTTVTGFGARFVGLSRRHRHALQSFVEELESACA